MSYINRPKSWQARPQRCWTNEFLPQLYKG